MGRNIDLVLSTNQLTDTFARIAFEQGETGEAFENMRCQTPQVTALATRIKDYVEREINMSGTLNNSKYFSLEKWICKSEEPYFTLTDENK